MLKYHIQTIEVPSGGSSAITFSNIPQIYDDLVVVASLRDGSSAVAGSVRLWLNGSNANFSFRDLQGTGSSAGSGSGSNGFLGNTVGNTATANTFSNLSLCIPNYRSSNNKSFSVDNVTETNGTTAYQNLVAGLWANTAAVSSLALVADSNLLQHSSASLYGIKRGDSKQTTPAFGGTVTTSGGFTIHTFTSSGTFTVNRDLDVEYLVVGGGGGGEGDPQFSASAAGGGAGGYRCSVQGELSGGSTSPEPQFRALSGTNYTVTVGAGGAGGTPSVNPGSRGSSSIFGSITSFGGGGGDNYDSPQLNGSGGGAGNTVKAGITGTAGQGTTGGASTNPSETYQTGGGGGAGTAGSTPNGGAGLTSSITGTAVARGGGGGGAVFSGTQGVGGIGGGGSAVSGAGTANTGGGGGGGRLGTSGGAGGSGIVIIRYLTPA